MNEILADISCQVSSALLLAVSAGYCQRGLVGESGMIRTQMGKHNRRVTVTVYMPPRHGHSLRRMKCNSASLKEKSYERFSAQYKSEKIYGE
jgi:hypothetical protein